ncbi:hypothetical protein P9209_06740 [Prescottella defluvii]|nr:hypothetical protein P9209_06740 [Prescottella defluvii]
MAIIDDIAGDCRESLVRNHSRGGRNAPAILGDRATPSARAITYRRCRSRAGRRVGGVRTSRARTSGRSRLDARLNAVQNGSLTLGYLTYGVGATITLPPSEYWYHVNITLFGGSRVSRGDSVYGETAAMAGAAMLVPHHSQTIEWDSDTAQFALRVPRADMESHLESLTQTRISDPVDFDLVVDLNSNAGRDCCGVSNSCGPNGTTKEFSLDTTIRGAIWNR